MYDTWLECGTWYHHPRRIQCVRSRNLRIFKVATLNGHFELSINAPKIDRVVAETLPLFAEPPLLNMNIDGNFDITRWRHRWRNHREKLFWHNLGRSFHIWGKFEAMFNISKVSKWPPFWASGKNILLEVIPKVEYAIKIAINISDILNFRSTL